MDKPYELSVIDFVDAFSDRLVEVHMYERETDRHFQVDWQALEGALSCFLPYDDHSGRALQNPQHHIRTVGRFQLVLKRQAHALALRTVSQR